jgi:hypothetical protein
VFHSEEDAEAALLKYLSLPDGVTFADWEDACVAYDLGDEESLPDWFSYKTSDSGVYQVEVE